MSAVRPGLIVAIGLLGAWLPLVLPERLQQPVWLAIVFVGVLVLHRAERMHTPRRLYPFMIAALALTLVPSSPAGVSSLLDWSALALAATTGLTVLLAGVLFFRRPDEDRIRAPLRGAALALASPLVLFASRAPTRARPACVLLLCGLASPLLSPGRDFVPQPIRGLIDVDAVFAFGRGFSLHAWLACAIVFVWSSWPDSPRRCGPGLSRPLLMASLVATALLVLAVIDRQRFMDVLAYGLFMLLSVGVPLALLALTSPPFRPRWLPGLPEPAPECRMGAAGTLLFVTMAALPLTAWCSPAIRALFSGRLFREEFSQTWVGWTLDQSTVQSGFWRFTALGIAALSHLAVARWLSDRTTPLRYWAFAAPTLALSFGLFCYLTCVVSSLCAYVGALGVTPLRVYGLFYGLCCYLACGLLLRWLLRPPASPNHEAGRVCSPAAQDIRHSPNPGSARVPRAAAGVPPAAPDHEAGRACSPAL